ncbi:TonB-dependent receptor [Sphingomonas bacterium]|uniref:TonB-dependent receptor n=1 Tax=Sphingomonas bacterium TaxID=1895847 RepID=UPI0015753DE8|nr:TonB-dependent receptor [Sphingomonas bacterium]
MQRKYLFVASCLALSVANVAHAQSAPPVATPAADSAGTGTGTGNGPAAAEPGSVGDIVVTGRKRDERLLQVPVSITAYTDAKLADLNLVSIADIGKITPGFKFEQQAFNNGYRFLSQTRFRGMVASSPRPNTQVGAVFVDGAFVAVGAGSLNTDDVERVEVIKGPQSVYFGRNTFGGAVNFITREPGDELRVTGKSEVKTYGGYDVGGSIEDAIIPGLLNGRVVIDSYRNGGQYDSGDGNKVGEQDTKSISASFLFTPTDRLKVRARVSYQRDDDYGDLIENYSLVDANCVVGARPFFCGAIPHSGSTYRNYLGQTVTVDSRLAYQDTSLLAPALVVSGRPNALNDLIHNTNGALNDVSFINKVPSLNHFGSTDRILRANGSADYDLGGGYAFSTSVGYGQDRGAALRDDDNVLGYATARPNCASTLPAAAFQTCILNNTNFVYIPFIESDLTAEARVSSPRDRRLRLVFGVSYFKQWIDGNLSSAGKTLVAGTGSITPFVNNDRDRSYAAAVFGSASFDILKTLTLDLEGRYQKDALRQFTQSGSYAAGTIAFTPVGADFNKFLPRAILTWKPTRDTTLYASYSIGELAGVSNVSFNNEVAAVARNPTNPIGSTDPAVISKYLAGLLGYSGTVPTIVPAEQIKQVELGWKQSFWNGRGALTVAGYHIDWTNMKTSAAVTAPSDLDGNGVLDPVGATLPGKSRIWGAEFQLDLQPVRRLSLTLQGEKVSQKFTSYTIYGVAAQIISPNAQASGVGTTLPQYPTSTLFGSARYSAPISANVSAYGQVESTLTGRQYLDEGNQAWIAPYDTVNLRLGVSMKAYRVEAYVTNLFDYSGPVGGRRNTLGDGFVGVTIYPAQLRTFGLRGSFAF